MDCLLAHGSPAAAPEFDSRGSHERSQGALAASLDCLPKGEGSELGDLLLQRFKAIDLGLPGNEAAAPGAQLVGTREGGLTGYRKLEREQRYQRNQLNR